MTTIDTTRNADLTTLRDMLLSQQTRKVDIIAPAAKIKSREGIIHVTGMEPIIDESGVTLADGQYQPTRVFDEGLASKLSIPLAYVRRLRDERPDLLDVNVNGWLHGQRAKVDFRQQDPETGAYKEIRPATPGDPRSFMLRTYKGDDGGIGVARALLSDRYGTIDNLDALVAVLAGVQQADASVKVTGCDLTERRMYVRVQSLNVSTLAPALLAGYRSPYSGNEGADNPVVWAGFVFGNSEVGNGSFSIVPRVVFEVCDNGMTISKDADRHVHLGGRQEESVIRWSHDTTEKELAVITAKARDAVATFLSQDYLESVVAAVTEKASVPVTNAAEAVKVISKKLSFSEETTAGVLDMFIRGGQVTAGGVMQAVTAYAQQVEDADLASSLEDDALKALDLAAAL